MKARSQEEYDMFRQAVAHLLMSLGGEDDKDTKGPHGRPRADFPDKDVIGAITRVLRHEAFIHKNLQPIDGRAANGMSVMAMGAHTAATRCTGRRRRTTRIPIPG